MWHQEQQLEMPTTEYRERERQVLLHLSRVQNPTGKCRILFRFEYIPLKCGISSRFSSTMYLCCVLVPKLKAAFTSIPLCWTNKLSKSCCLPQELTDMRYNNRSQKIRREQQGESFQIEHKGNFQDSTRMTFSYSWSNGYLNESGGI